MSFPKDFVWGVATAAYQVEGAAHEDGRGESIWDSFCRQPGKVFQGNTGDVACDHYHRYKEDVALMAEMGIKAYRFSISWPRVLPEGTGEINQMGLAFYSDLVDELLKHGITPYITLFHWDLPLALHHRGGWMNADSPWWFAEYAGVIVDALSDRVKHFITFNEPQVFIGIGCMEGIHAPGLRYSTADTVRMSHHVLLAHGMAVRAMRAKARQPIEIGYAPTASMHYPLTDSKADIEAARKATFALDSNPQNWCWNIPWWSDPVFFGEYPEEGLKLYGKYLPDSYPEDLKIISTKIDFLGHNIYNGSQVKAGANGEPVFVDRYEGFPKTALNWPVTPESLYWGPRFLYERYKMPLYVTENGLSCHDVISLDGEVHDPNRIDFYQRYLRAYKKASEDGADLRGYFAWSLMDNFEWHSGYADRFGLIYVDYRDQRRIVKDSGRWYKGVIESNGETL